MKNYVFTLTGEQIDHAITEASSGTNFFNRSNEIDNMYETSGVPAGSFNMMSTFERVRNFYGIPQYNNENTYYSKDLCIYGNNIYICLVNSTTGSWNPNHWGAVVLGDLLTSVEDAINLVEKIVKAKEITPERLAAVAGSGYANEYFGVGDIIYIPWTDRSGETEVEYNVPVVIADFVDAEDEKGNIHKNSIVLMWLYATPIRLAFDYKEINPVEAGETIEEGFYYYEKSGNSYNMLADQPVPGDVVPSGKTYYKNDYANIESGIARGLSNWKLSTVRQWLNSDAEPGAGWWVGSHPCDVGPDSESAAWNCPGFMNGFPSEWRSIFKASKVATYTTEAFTDDIDYTYDKFFLPSESQIYGSQHYILQGAYWQYCKNISRFNSPTNGSSSNIDTARQIPIIPPNGQEPGEAVGIWLRDIPLTSNGTANAIYALGYYADGGSCYGARYFLPCTILF